MLPSSLFHFFISGTEADLPSLERTVAHQFPSGMDSLASLSVGKLTQDKIAPHLYQHMDLFLECAEPLQVAKNINRFISRCLEILKSPGMTPEKLNDPENTLLGLIPLSLNGSGWGGSQTTAGLLPMEMKTAPKWMSTQFFQRYRCFKYLNYYFYI